MTFLSSLIAKTLTGVMLSTMLALPAVAQEATDETAEPEATQEVDPNFAMGEEVDENGNPVPQEPQPGQQYLSEVIGDWALRCLKVAEGDDPCQMYQLLSDGAGNNVAEVAIVTLPNSGQAVAGATIVVPLETLLTEQITMRVDGGQARRFPFNFCNQGGCVTRIGLTQEDINLFKRGAAATFTVVPASAPEEAVTVTMSLSGFTAGYEAVSQ